MGSAGHAVRGVLETLSPMANVNSLFRLHDAHLQPCIIPARLEMPRSRLERAGLFTQIWYRLSSRLTRILSSMSRRPVTGGADTWTGSRGGQSGRLGCIPIEFL